MPSASYHTRSRDRIAHSEKPRTKSAHDSGLVLAVVFVLSVLVLGGWVGGWPWLPRPPTPRHTIEQQPNEPPFLPLACFTKRDMVSGLALLYTRKQ